MNRYLTVIVFFMISINLFSYTYQYSGGDGMCDEYAKYQIADDYWTGPPSYWEPRVVEIVKNAANYWNEAGSEHRLIYDGRGTSNPEIEWDDNCGSPACAHLVTNGSCIVTSLSTIEIDKNEWLKEEKKNSFKLQNVLAHEFGHLLGLGHTDDDTHIINGNDEWYYYSILMHTSSLGISHLTEDDKYGVKRIYGEDDQNLKISASSSQYSYIPSTGVKNYTTGNSDFQSYSKPDLIYQPNTNKGYDYIMTWVKSNTTEINYRFVNDCGTNNKDLCKASGTLGNRHYIGSSSTITSPSIAISDGGQYAVVVWKQEAENQPQNNADDIWYSRIPTYSHSCNIDVNCGNSYKSHRLFNNTIYGNDVYAYDNYKAKTVSKPEVVWVKDWNRFVIFYSKLDFEDNNGWSISYIISDDQYGNFSSNPIIHHLSVKANWNPMAVDCRQTYYVGGTKICACLLVYNEINTNPNTNSADHVAKTSFKILEPKHYYDQLYFVEKDIITTGDWDRRGYGHYSLASREYTGQPYKTVNLLNRITKSARNVVDNLRFVIYKSGSNWYGNTISNYKTTSTFPGYPTSYLSRTGFTIVYNKAKQIYKYLWIEE